MEKLFALSLVLAFICGGVVLSMRIKIEAHLEARHPGLWIVLRSPRIARVTKDLAANDNFVAFFANKKHLQLNDLALNRLAFVASVLSKVTLSFVAIAIFAGAAVWVLPFVQSR